jgi:DNA-binding NtrC family response regulator
MGYPIHIPPLRKRPSDIPIIANFFLRQFLRRNKLKSLIFTQEAKDKLAQYPYPGNIRELKTVVETSAMMSTNSEINASDLSLHPIQTFPLANWLEGGLSLEEITYEAIQYYLKKNNGNVLEAAKELKIGKSTIYRIIKSS